ncbi:hypothetical protein SAMN05880568_2899 [Microbacterium sp. RURRCA19A]|nr:hypothetical protein SAMN05880568_2899 [Microbacterium sp. RURRCA19A]
MVFVNLEDFLHDWIGGQFLDEEDHLLGAGSLLVVSVLGQVSTIALMNRDCQTRSQVLQGILVL